MVSRRLFVVTAVTLSAIVSYTLFSDAPPSLKKNEPLKSSELSEEDIDFIIDTKKNMKAVIPDTSSGSSESSIPSAPGYTVDQHESS